MNSTDWIGSSAPALALLRAAREGHMVHAYLLKGPAGTGKRTLANMCAQTLNCQGASKPCGHCPPCLRHQSGNHPDLIVLNAPKSIGVDDIRALIDALAMRPYEGGRRVVIIDGADRMTVQAQNALLKTLETPPDETVFFLLADSAESLLPTIRSRCRIMRFLPLPAEDIARALIARGTDDRRAHLIAALSDGSLGRALEMDASPEYWALRARVGASLAALQAGRSVAEAFAPLRDEQGHAAVILDMIESWARAMMIERETGAPSPQFDMPGLHNDKGNFGANVLQSIIVARMRLSSNVSWQSAMEMLFTDISEV